MRALHFLPVYAPAWQFGGPVLSVSRLCEGLVREGVDVRVITTNAGLPDFPIENLGKPCLVNGVSVTYYPVDKQSGPIWSDALVNALPDHMIWANLLHLSSIWQPLGNPVQHAAHAAGVPVIQTLRGALGPYSWRRGLWKKLLYYYLKERPLLQRSTLLHCTTQQEANEIAWLHLKPRIELLPNPLELSKLYYAPDSGNLWRIKNHIPLNDPILLVVGRLHHKKGLDLLPKVLKELAHREWQIVFIGRDEDGTGLRLKSQLSRLGLSARCHWLSSLPSDDLIGPYNAASCLLLPSRHENFGNVVVESLACGCGVLISDKVGVSESIRDCPGVRIVPRSAQTWISQLHNILNSTRPGVLSAQWVAKSFSKESVAKQAHQIYVSMLSHA